MASNVVPETWALALWDYGASGVFASVEIVVAGGYPYTGLFEGVESSYVNKVWDAISGGWVRWSTNYEDVDGVAYPGPGTFGVDTSSYRVESIKFTDAE
jgi:hypothetical protein